MFELTREQQNRALHILHNMALERTRWPWRLFRRWHISQEPLRSDAGNFIREIGYGEFRPYDTRLAGDSIFDRR
jgi:hypothetical protein